MFNMDRAIESYLMGVVASDGSLGHKNGIPDYVGYYSTDKDWLEGLRIILDPTRPLFIAAKPKNERQKVTWGFTLRNEWVKWFMGRGLKRKAEQEFEDFEGIDLFHFLRGHLDGDGSIQRRKSSGTLSKVRWLGRVRFIEGMAKALGEVGYDVHVDYQVRKGRITLATIEVGGRQGYQLLCRVYERAELFLPRKRKIFDGLKAPDPRRRGWRRKRSVSSGCSAVRERTCLGSRGS